jgi:hypothetical protein
VDDEMFFRRSWFVECFDHQKGQVQVSYCLREI